MSMHDWEIKHEMARDERRLREENCELRAEVTRLRAALQNIIAGNGGECGCAETARHALNVPSGNLDILNETPP